MNEHLPSIIEFYKEAFILDSNQQKTLHLESTRIEKKYSLFKREELLTGAHPYVPISYSKGEEIEKTLALRGKEVDFRYFSFARISRFHAIGDKEVTRIYPLLSYSAHLEFKEGEYYISLDLEQPEILVPNLPQRVAGNPRMIKALQSGQVDLSFASRLKEAVDLHFPTAESDDLLLYPDLWSTQKVNAVKKRTFEKQEQYIPIGLLCIVSKEDRSYSIIEELDQLSKKNDFSKPLDALFDPTENDLPEKRGIICEELNMSQTIAIDNANSSVISVISGPPGTGKSFTIANMAAEKMSKGQSVLITSKNKEALTVIQEKIEGNLGLKQLLVNPTQDNTFTSLKSELKHVLGRGYKLKNISWDNLIYTVDKIEERLQELRQIEAELEDEFMKRRDLRTNIKAKIPEDSRSEFRKRIYLARSRFIIPLWELLDEYYEHTRKTKNAAKLHLKQVRTYMLEEMIKENRMVLRAYESFLKARNNDRKKKLAAQVNYDVVLKAFPLWLVKASEVSKVLPLTKELFDVLIIDEASQCDIPSLIPLLQRARKVIIVGDQKQLNPISFISKRDERTLRDRLVPEEFRAICSHRNTSILDLATENISGESHIQLNEHFRSQYPIIAFSNRTFYSDDLRIMSKRPEMSIDQRVDLKKLRGRYENGVNKTEVEEVLQFIRTRIDEEKEIPHLIKTSIGVLSPFRKQVDELFKCIRDEFSTHEIIQHRINVGTAFSFQGNEKDVMILSLGVDDRAKSGSYTYLNRRDVFNVSVTRARHEQIILHSFAPKNLNPDSLLASFFRFYKNDLENDQGRATKDRFCHEVLNALDDTSFSHWTNFNVAGVSIDLLLKASSTFIGIDFIGYEGEMLDYYSLERYKMIERSGIRLFPLSYQIWLKEPEKCIETIKYLLL